ncbi:MAG: restriction endonuclease subunit S [Bacteroidales bacterium]
MKTILKNIANIQTGLFAKPAVKGDIVFLQARHFDENGLLNSTLHPDLLKEDISEKHLLRQGDVLFSAKGTKNFAAWYKGDNPAAVASTSFFVIRLHEEYSTKILPPYLVWFLNHPEILKYLKANAIGTSMVSISKGVLENLEIPIPSLDYQQILVNITQLRLKEKELMDRIEALKDKQIQQLTFNALKQY